MHYGCKLQSFNGKSDFTFFVNHFTAISYVSHVNWWNFFINRLEAISYKRFVDDIYSKGNKSQQVVLFEVLNNFHLNIKLTTEVNPVKFLDTKIILNNEVVVTTQIYLKENKKAVPWVCNIIKRYKRNTISGDLDRSTILAKIFQTNCSFSVKEHPKGKVQFLFFKIFLLVITKC